MATDITKAQTQEFMIIPDLITKVILNFKPFRGKQKRPEYKNNVLLLNLQSIKTACAERT